ncbi:MAG: GNAT family N-acetyltransferase [Thermoflexales bacterium]|nr:GNAT family N-acetyltransferase [Thermoflexales bacterium]
MCSSSNFTSQLDIAPTRPEEVDAIRAIIRGVGAFDDEEVMIGDELVREYLSRGALASGYTFLSCRSDGRVLGFACYGPRALTHGNTFDLYWIAVDKSAQGRGAGGALLQRVAQAVQAMGGRLIIAETSGRADYLPTRRFYETHGYERAATIPDFYAPGDDLVVYVQRLPAGSMPGEHLV